MTFKKFEQLFLNNYPEGSVYRHGEMGGTQRNKKVAVTFKANGKVYEYYGAYEDILCRVGVNVISKQRLRECEMTLEMYKKWHGKPGLFGGVMDKSADIERLTKQIEDYKKNCIIV